jgi:hypothetical protein
MPIRIILLPHNLYELANTAKEDMTDVQMSPQQVRDVAEEWHKDREKIKYLETLIIRRK